MKQGLNILLTILMLFFVGCSPSYQISDDINYSVISRIDSGRNSGTVRIVNKSGADIVCDRLNFRAVTDNPTNYLETGEEFLDTRFVYSRRSSEKLVSRFNVPRLDDDFRAIATISTDCRKANVFDFCRFGLPTSQEEVALLALMQHDTVNCSKLKRNVQNKKQVNLSGLKFIPARPFILMPKLKIVIASQGAVIDPELLKYQEVEIKFR